MQDDVIKRLWNKYVQENPCQTEELTGILVNILNYSKNMKQLFLWELLFLKLNNATCFLINWLDDM